LTRLIYQGLSYVKQARVAIMADSDAQIEIPSKLAKHLDVERNYQWSGPARQYDLDRRRPRALVGEYVEWFQWYMRFQRFKAFRTVVLIDPVSAASDGQVGGFIDGLIIRLMIKVPQVVVVSRGGVQVPQFEEERLDAVLMALLYGTRLSRAQLVDAVKLAIVAIPDKTLQKALDGWRWRSNLRNARYELSQVDEELVQGMVPRWKSAGPEEPLEKIEQLFQRRQRREYIRPETGWVTDEVLKLAKLKGWFTSQTLNAHFAERYEEFAKSEVPPPAEVYPYVQREYPSAAQIFRLSASIIRRVCDTLVEEGSLTTHQWYREIGRPALVYTESGGVLPFLKESKCGQCSFYAAAKKECRIWSLARWKYRSWGFRWAGPGKAPSDFEMYKLKNSHRIGPHSSACRLFLDKKRDHLRNKVPSTCEVCMRVLNPEKPGMVICLNCDTVYSPWGGKVKVQTGYEHEFRKKYKEITSSDAEEDQLKRGEEWSKSPQRDIERMMPLASEPEFPSHERPKPERMPWPRPTFNLSLQRLIDEKVQTTDITRQLSLAMLQSAISATRRLALVGRPDPDLMEEAIRKQERYLSLAEEAKRGRFLAFEAHTMKEYWACYDSALKPAQQWFGPRVRYRFVPQFVDEPGGRTKGYSALHAAINYLHQRRLRQALRINAEIGYEGTADGFLHRESYNSRRTGLLFDMIDPFKFADREELLAVVLDRGITWRDFKMESDRYNSTFYYPGPTAIDVLNQAGADSDQLVVRYQGIDSSLTDAYRKFATSLFAAISPNEKQAKLEPFVYSPV